MNKQKLLAKLQDKEYRDLFVSEHIDTGIPFQIRALREARDWTQTRLAEESSMAQSRISLVENPGYGNFSLNTLKRIASVFDVALMVRLVSFSELVDWVTGTRHENLGLSPETFVPKSFGEDVFSTSYTSPESTSALSYSTETVGEVQRADYHSEGILGSVGISRIQDHVSGG